MCISAIIVAEEKSAAVAVAMVAATKIISKPCDTCGDVQAQKLPSHQEHLIRRPVLASQQELRHLTTPS